MENVEKKIDFLGFGDIVTDAFILLKEAEIEYDDAKSEKKLCMSFGDKIPYESVEVVPAVGNSTNAAVSAHRLGLNSAIVTHIGDDDNGRECLEQLEKEGINTEFVTTQKGEETNYHYVLRFKDERTILVKHHLYDYNFPNIAIPPRWIYLSSLAENSLPYQQQIADYVEAHPETKMVFQPGTFQIKIGYEKLKKIYKNSELFFCNKEEAQRILGTFNKDIKDLLIGLRNLGPKIISITDGPNGAYAYDGTDIWFGPMYPDPRPPISRTGAGDAFSSTFTSAIILGKSIPEALQWAPINSMSVVQQIGAQKGLLTLAQLEKYLAEAPADYKPKKL
ncbi:MAG: PfkB family carbohydrate kinase [Candidatus Paceibacterota bacterium]